MLLRGGAEFQRGKQGQEQKIAYRSDVDCAIGIPFPSITNFAQARGFLTPKRKCRGFFFFIFAGDGAQEFGPSTRDNIAKVPNIYDTAQMWVGGSKIFRALARPVRLIFSCHLCFVTAPALTWSTTNPQRYAVHHSFPRACAKTRWLGEKCHINDSINTSRTRQRERDGLRCVELPICGFSCLSRR